MTSTTSDQHVIIDLTRLLPDAHALPPQVDGEQRFAVPVARLAEACDIVATQAQARLATMVGEDDRAASGCFRLSYVFAPATGGWVTIETSVDANDPRFPSVTPNVSAAHWYEREVQDMLGITAAGHPDPRRLVLHDDWPDGVHPLRKDFDPAIAVPRVERPPQRMHTLHGDGITEIPVGPIHAGVIEPGHFRFAAVGETVLHLEVRLFYTHRGIEKLVEGKPVEQVLQVAERICGLCACSHGVSYAQAVEAAAGVAVPPRAAALRTLYLELERLYNHLGDLGNMCAGFGFAVGNAFGARIKEEAQRLNERVTGSRFLRGVIRLGGVRGDLSPEAAADIEATLAWLARDLGDFIALVVGSDTSMERLHKTGVLSRETAVTLGAVGIAARASGVDLDARRDHPHAYYDRLPMRVPVVVRTGGDAYARFLNRMDEAIASIAIIRAVLANLPGGPLAVDLGPLPAGRAAYAVTESARGENLHWLRLGPGGTVARYRVRSASFPNWPAVAASVPGNLVPDFPLINKSFNLCYACLDR